MESTVDKIFTLLICTHSLRKKKLTKIYNNYDGLKKLIIRSDDPLIRYFLCSTCTFKNPDLIEVISLAIALKNNIILNEISYKALNPFLQISSNWLDLEIDF